MQEVDRYSQNPVLDMGWHSEDTSVFSVLTPWGLLSALVQDCWQLLGDLAVLAKPVLRSGHSCIRCLVALLACWGGIQKEKAGMIIFALEKEHDDVVWDASLHQSIRLYLLLMTTQDRNPPVSSRTFNRLSAHAYQGLAGLLGPG